MELAKLPEPSLVEAVPGSYIYVVENALSQDECDHLIETFEAHKEDHYDGHTAGGVNQSMKCSTDALLRGQQHWRMGDEILFQSLHRSVRELGDLVEFFRIHTIKDKGYQIQRTKKGGFYHWHHDGGGEAKDRAMACIWYLNTLADNQGGTTDFFDQQVSVRPKAGKLLLFPPYWTHKHRGDVLKYGKKYIATTWLVDM